MKSYRVGITWLEGTLPLVSCISKSDSSFIDAIFLKHTYYVLRWHGTKRAQRQQRRRSHWTSRTTWTGRYVKKTIKKTHRHHPVFWNIFTYWVNLWSCSYFSNLTTVFWHLSVQICAQKCMEAVCTLIFLTNARVDCLYLIFQWVLLLTALIGGVRAINRQWVQYLPVEVIAY